MDRESFFLWMVARLAGGLPLTEKDEKVYTEAVHWSGKGGRHHAGKNHPGGHLR